MKIFLENTTVLIPDSEGVPDFSMLREPTLSLAMAAFDVGSFEIIEAIPITLSPNWDGLLNRLLSGSLFPLFQAITLAAFSNPVILIARTDIYGAISNPAISDRISALRAGLDILQNSGYQISEADRALWNNAIADLNFPESLRL